MDDTRPLVIIQNDPEVPPGILADILTEYGRPFKLLHPYRGEPLPTAAEPAALIVLGGSMGADDDAAHPFLTPLKELIRAVVTAGVPYLGICLGGQLLAAALGAAVVPRRWEELGALPVHLTTEGGSDPLFAGIASPFSTFQWHHDSFDLPAGALLLASSPACRHQAFRVGSHAWGLQFHPEVTEAIIRDWCAWNAETATCTEELVAGFTRHGPAYGLTAERLVKNFLTCLTTA